MYIPGHSFFVAYGVETGIITESTNGTTPAALPLAPTSLTVVGYTNVPEQKAGLNNARGYGVGANYALYKKRGTVAPSLSFTLRAGSVGLLERINPVNGVLPWLCFAVGVPGVKTTLYRFCKMGQLALSTRESSAEASEVEAALTVEATARQRLTTPLNPSLSSLLALGDPLVYHDLRVSDLTDSTGATISLGRNLMSLSATLTWNLERKANRPNWGDDKPLSRTSYDMLEHLITPTGELGLHDELPAAFVDATANALDWGDLVLNISNFTGTRAVNLTLTDLMPSDFTSAGVEPSAQQSHTVSFTAANYSLTTTST